VNYREDNREGGCFIPVDLRIVDIVVDKASFAGFRNWNKM
jgi:hypothetical protein